MPELDGMQVTAELGRALPDCAVVMLAGRGRPPHLQRSFAAGALGLIPRAPPAER